MTRQHLGGVNGNIVKGLVRRGYVIPTDPTHPTWRVQITRRGRQVLLDNLGTVLGR